MTKHLCSVLSLGNCNTDLDFLKALTIFSNKYSKGVGVFNRPINRISHHQQPYKVKTVTVYLGSSLETNPSLNEIVSKNLRDTVIVLRDYNFPHDYINSLFLPRVIDKKNLNQRGAYYEDDIDKRLGEMCPWLTSQQKK